MDINRNVFEFADLCKNSAHKENDVDEIMAKNEALKPIGLKKEYRYVKNQHGFVFDPAILKGYFQGGARSRGLSIHPFHKNDLRACFELEQAQQLGAYRKLEIDLEHLLTKIPHEDIQNILPISLVAKDRHNGSIVGFAGCRFMACNSGRALILHIRALVVRKALFRRSIATCLLHAVTHIAKEFRVEYLAADTYDWSSPSYRQLLFKTGFEGAWVLTNPVICGSRLYLRRVSKPVTFTPSMNSYAAQAIQEEINIRQDYYSFPNGRFVLPIERPCILKLLLRRNWRTSHKFI
ncbi:unnamed protein product [Caenorhabditis auriculariae]|uniref:N-acetyltransferase domain-containing protein n=1 Tax=Caenorhabditis auriculariae TaxID=2777116 RepID=A0A8S1GZG7_9PELO|nr:unnamed protein product [Caenorhabditis auriculariae]